jgi:hypothetical protein
MGVNLNVAGVDHQPLEVGLDDQFFQQPLPETLVAPAAKASVGVFPISVVGRQIAPRGSGAQDPEHRIEKKPVVFGLPSPEALLPGEMGFEEIPGSFRDVVAAVGGSGDGDSLGEVRGFSPILPHPSIS